MYVFLFPIFNARCKPKVFVQRYLSSSPLSIELTRRRKHQLEFTMSESPDYYDILGVTRGAADAEIKRNYRKLAMKWHPDKNQNSAEASEMFQNIGEAYDVLSDKQKKAIYDQYGYEVK